MCHECVDYYTVGFVVVVIIAIIIEETRQK